MTSEQCVWNYTTTFILTGSVSMALECEANAKKARSWNSKPLASPYAWLGAGNSIINITTYSAYIINNQVNTTQMIPHMSFTHHKWGGKSRANFARPNLLRQGPQSITTTPSSTGRRSFFITGSTCWPAFLKYKKKNNELSETIRYHLTFII